MWVLSFWISIAKSVIIKEKLNEELTLAKNEMKSKMDQISTSVEEIKKTQKESMKPVIAFRATCAKNFPSSTYNTYKSENPGTKAFLISILVKLTSSDLLKIQLFGKILNTILETLSMQQMVNSPVHMMEFILFM